MPRINSRGVRKLTAWRNKRAGGGHGQIMEDLLRVRPLKIRMNSDDLERALQIEHRSERPSQEYTVEELMRKLDL
jgi:hypothetical protein